MHHPLTDSTMALTVTLASSLLPTATGVSQAYRVHGHNPVPRRRLQSSATEPASLADNNSNINNSVNNSVNNSINNSVNNNSNSQMPTPTHHSHGIHYVDIFVGSPAQSQALIVSTLEDRVSFPCKGCTSCKGSESRFYNQHLSSRFEFVPCSNGSGCQHGATCWKDRVCQVSTTSMDSLSSWSAFDATDVVYVGGDAASQNPVGTNIAETDGFPLDFGCQISLQGERFEALEGYADGFLGMSPKPTSFLHQMYRGGHIDHRAFSLCFDPLDSQESTTGAITMGRPLTEAHETPMLFAKNIDPLNRYQLYLERIYIRPRGGTTVKTIPNDDDVIPVKADYINLNTGDRRVVIDSASTFTQLDVALKEPFEAAWKEATGVDYSTSDMSIPEEDLDLMPAFVFQFTGWNTNLSIDPASVPGLSGIIDQNHQYSVLVNMPACHYMVRNDQNGRYYSRLFVDHPEGSVLGADFLRGHDVLFDVEDGRVGFSEVQKCKDKSQVERQYREKQTADVDESSPEARSNNDGPLPTQVEAKMETDDDDECGGTYYSCCNTVTCRSFVAMGYAFVGTVALAILMAMLESRHDRRRKKKQSNSGVNNL